MTHSTTDLVSSPHLRGLAVACWTTDHYPCSNPGMGISEGCLSLRLITFRGRSAHLAYLVHKSGRKHQSSSSSSPHLGQDNLVPISVRIDLTNRRDTPTFLPHSEPIHIPTKLFTSRLEYGNIRVQYRIQISLEHGQI